MNSKDQAIINAYLERVPNPVYIEEIPYDIDPFDMAIFLEELGYEDVVGMDECEVRKLYVRAAEKINFNEGEPHGTEVDY